MSQNGSQYYALAEDPVQHTNETGHFIYPEHTLAWDVVAYIAKNFSFKGQPIGFNRAQTHALAWALSDENVIDTEEVR